MTDHLDSVEDPSAEELATINALLAHREVWDDPSADVQERVVDAIVADRTPPDLDRAHHADRSWGALPRWLAAAAVAAIAIAGIAVVTRGADDEISVSLSGTDAAPGASADARLTATPAGLKILLDTDGLEPAPDGFFYETWVSNGTIRVSAGSFHVRRGDGPIELWAGVVDPGFTVLAVTLEPIDGDTDSSGDVRLRGRYQLTGD